MTEAEWQACEDLWVMVPYINRNASERKMRLLAVAFCRHISHLFSEDRCQELLKWAKLLSAIGDEAVPPRADCLLHAVDEAERYAEGSIPVAQVEAVSHIADRLSFVEEYHYACYTESWGPRDFKLFASSVAASAISYTACAEVDIEQVHKLAARAVLRFEGSDENKEDRGEELAQCKLVRDLFPNPFRPVAFSPSWHTDTTVLLAQQMYDSRDFSAMPVLADALQDAGCDNDGILSHCRGDGPHVRGCWVVDLVLGKA